MKFLVSHLTWKFLSAVDHLLHFLNYRNAANKMLLLIYLKHLGSKILSLAMAKFLNCINASCLKKLCKLRTYALYAEKIVVLIADTGARYLSGEMFS